MVFISDDNTLNPIIPTPIIGDAYGNYGGIDYEHMHSATINDNRPNPVVSKISPEYLPKTFITDPRDIGKNSEINNRSGSLGFEPRLEGMLERFSGMASNRSANTYTMLDNSADDPDIVYSAAQPIGSNSGHNSSSYSHPSRSLKILERPTREGETLPSILQNRSERVALRKIGKY